MNSWNHKIAKFSAGEKAANSKLSRQFTAQNKATREVLRCLLGIGTDLGGIGCNMLVHAVNASVGSSSPCIGRLLPCTHSEAQVLRCLPSVVHCDMQSLFVTSLGGFE